MSNIGSDCPACHDTGPLKVDKTSKLKDWGVFCWMCGHHQGPGSYWNYHEGGYKKHCEDMGWEDDGTR